MMRRTLDEVDGAWGDAPPDATGLILRCYALRRKPLEDLTVEDLRLGIGQEIALRHLMPLAIRVLELNPLAEGDMYRGDLLNAVLNVGADFWEANQSLKSEVAHLVDRVDDVDEDLQEAIAGFRTL
jgi:hypothetical protein